MVWILLSIDYAQHSFECLSMRSTNAVQDEASIGAVSVASVQSLQQSVKSLNEQLSHVQSANREHEAAKTERETALQSLQSLHSQSQSTIDDLNEQLAAKQADMEKLVSCCNRIAFQYEQFDESISIRFCS